MKQYTLGVIGGMGPKATSVFYDKIIAGTDAHKDQDHINMIILSHATLPDRTTAIFNNTGKDFLEHMKKDIQLLELAGVDNIAIPCNTSHYFYEDLAELTDLHIINMVEETAKKIYEDYGENSKVGLLATKGTISSGIYKKACEKYKINLLVPNESIQDQTMKIIYDNVKSGLSEDSSELEDLIKNFVEKDNCDCVILACTELSVIQLSKETKQHCIDAMEVLVNKSIELSGKALKR